MDALILVDLQPDFLPGGALAVSDGDAVLPVAADLAGRFDLVVATQDWHPADHGSFAVNADGEVGGLGELAGLPQVLWPVHCVQGSPGAQLHDSVDRGRLAAVFQKGTDPAVDSYSGFFDNGRRGDTGLSAWLRARGVTRTVICGLATDYCVKFTALDAVAEGFDVVVVSDACRGVELTPGDVAAAWGELRAAGVRIVDSRRLKSRDRVPG